MGLHKLGDEVVDLPLPSSNCHAQNCRRILGEVNSHGSYPFIAVATRLVLISGKFRDLGNPVSISWYLWRPMSLAVAFKSAEGIVLAADSRVTLMGSLPIPSVPQPAGAQLLPQMVVPAMFDNATILLSVKSQPHVGAITYGTAAIGQQAPRTVSSFLPEFEIGNARLTVEQFATRLGDFFTRQWTSAGMPANPPMEQDIFFFVGGYDDAAAYGRLFQLHIPNAPQPQEIFPNPGEFGATWGGQREITDRLLVGFDPAVPNLVQDLLNIPANQRRPNLEQELKNRLITPIPWPFLPLQDCVDLSIFVVRTTITLQKWLVGIRGVGGAVDVATITRTEGFRAIQVKAITGEKAHG
ncbi:MAG: hypothetical protein DMG96_37985 [Acidobacteria bacterium]|nr:MAG: hypothetical protein DMG96_37985 [Acidobacteriota bacterium]